MRGDRWTDKQKWNEDRGKNGAERSSVFPDLRSNLLSGLANTETDVISHSMHRRSDSTPRRQAPTWDLYGISCFERTRSANATFSVVKN
jgi:hypothetical protein